MTQSDWITVITSIISIFAAGIVSWVVYQAQQKLNFSEMATQLQSISEKVATCGKIENKIDKTISLSQIQEKVSRLDDQLAKTAKQIENNIQLKIKEHLEESKREFENKLKEELLCFVPEIPKREKISNEIVEVFMRTTGNISGIGDKDFNPIELGIRAPIQELQNALLQLRDTVDLRKLLTGPAALNNENIFTEQAVSADPATTRVR